MRQAVVDFASRPIRNVVPYPKWDVDAATNNAIGSWVPFGSGSIAATNSHDTDLAPAARGRTRVHTMTATGKWGRRFSLNEPIAVGERASFWMWLKASVECQVNPAIEWTSPDGITFNGGSTAPLVTLLANVWTKISHTAIAPANTGFFRTIGFTTPVDQVAGFVFKAGPSVAVIGSTVPDWYADGDTPGWRWTGTVGGSASVGYPYTLESIASKPVYFAENVSASSTVVATLTPGGPYTIAACQQVPGTTSSPGLWQLSETGTNQSRRLLAVTAGNPILRFDALREDSSLQGLTAAGPQQPTARHVSVSRIRATGQVMDAFLDGTLVTPSFTTTASSFRPLTATPVTMRVGVRDAAVQADAPVTHGFAIWEKELDAETAKRVTAWFARRYGTPIPAGY